MQMKFFWDGGGTSVVELTEIRKDVAYGPPVEKYMYIQKTDSWN